MSSAVEIKKKWVLLHARLHLFYHTTFLVDIVCALWAWSTLQWKQSLQGELTGSSAGNIVLNLCYVNIIIDWLSEMVVQKSLCTYEKHVNWGHDVDNPCLCSKLPLASAKTNGTRKAAAKRQRVTPAATEENASKEAKKGVEHSSDSEPTSSLVSDLLYAMADPVWLEKRHSYQASLTKKTKQTTAAEIEPRTNLDSYTIFKICHIVNAGHTSLW